MWSLEKQLSKTKVFKEWKLFCGSHKSTHKDQKGVKHFAPMTIESFLAISFWEVNSHN